MFYCFKLALPSGPLLILSSFSCFVCLSNCSLDMESMGGGHSSGMERFSGVCQFSGESADQAKEIRSF